MDSRSPQCDYNSFDRKAGQVNRRGIYIFRKPVDTPNQKALEIARSRI
ncbi:MAG: hypothetical protein KAR42_04325 [candidate division Zixibacteria bacterium]|nr:hypothetical protein [candidate division Zixibacteria bacterium]